MKVCFITQSSPTYLGGVSIYNKNLINQLKNKKDKLEITWAYFGDKDRKYIKDNITYIEIKKSIFQIPGIINNFKIRKFLTRNYFDVIFTTGGPWTFFYKNPPGQKIIHIYHGTVYYFNKNHLKRFGIFKQILLSPLLFLSKLAELPHYDRDKIICVSEKVKKQVESLYGEYDIDIIRTGISLVEFKPRKVKKKYIYGLFVGRGGFYTKGLDRAINLSRYLYKLNNNFRLIIIGPDESKVKDLLNEEFIIYLKDIKRNDMKYYYNIAKIFLCMSRFEGGGPTLTVGEAMSSGIMVVTSKDSKQEIIKNNHNGMIINSYGKLSAKKILKNVGNKVMIKNSLKTIQKLDLKSWADKFLKIIK